ncbi:MAG: CAP domain-containing protein [Beijerinckiaceae bacterium]
MNRFVALALSGLIMVLPVNGADASATTRDAAVIARMVSAHRAAHGLGPVRVDGKLNRAAQHHAEAMARQMVMSHDAGGDFSSRMDSFGVKGWSAENIAAGYRSANEAFSGWQTSYSHNTNMLKPMMTKIGLASSVGGDGRIYWTMVLSSH